MNTHESVEFRGNPSAVSAIEYVRGVLRAEREAGLVIDRAHLSTVYRKLEDELQIPRIRAIQILNRLEDAINKGETNVQLSVDELRMLIQTRSSLV